jgi:hypothetical protein
MLETLPLSPATEEAKCSHIDVQLFERWFKHILFAVISLQQKELTVAKVRQYLLPSLLRLTSCYTAAYTIEGVSEI